MKPVPTRQKYKCDFCLKRSVKHVMEVHEKRCYRNPNRFCDRCSNTGKYREKNFYGNEIGPELECKYCAKFDAKQLAEIEGREMGLI